MGAELGGGGVTGSGGSASKMGEKALADAVEAVVGVVYTQVRQPTAISTPSVVESSARN